MSGNNSSRTNGERVPYTRTTSQAAEPEDDLKSFEGTCSRIVGAAIEAAFRPSTAKNRASHAHGKTS